MNITQVNTTLSQLLDYLEIPEEDSFIKVINENDKLLLVLLSESTNQYYVVTITDSEFEQFFKPKGY